MPNPNQDARALFLAPNGEIYPDLLICSGVLPEQLKSEPCPLAENGRLPTPQPLDENSAKGMEGELCPPCVKEHLSSLAHWEGASGRSYPEALRPLRLFKCQQWYWFVIPGLYEAKPTQILQISHQ